MLELCEWRCCTGLSCGSCLSDRFTTLLYARETQQTQKDAYYWHQDQATHTHTDTHKQTHIIIIIIVSADTVNTFKHRL